MNIPVNLHYSEDHEWIRVEEGNIAYIGITDFAQGELDELVYIEVETVGESLKAGEIFGAIEAVKTTSDLFMPVDGKILEFNSELDESKEDNPTLVNKDPYEAGWIVKIEMTDPSQVEKMLTAEAYETLLAE